MVRLQEGTALVFSTKYPTAVGQANAYRGFVPREIREK
jgi:hypothetical protein